MESSKDMIDMLMYILLNPVKARCVRHSAKWPGLITKFNDFSKPSVSVNKPSIFFDKQGNLPDTIKFKPVPVPGFEDWSEKRYSLYIKEILLSKQQRICKDFDNKGKKFLGVKGVLAQNIYEYPWSSSTHRELNPQIKAKNKWLRIEMISKLVAFRKLYKEARAKFLASQKSVSFPPGTYQMGKYFKIKIEPNFDYAFG
jgi:hypothetical protein